jgi:hypothetical protein
MFSWFYGLFLGALLLPLSVRGAELEKVLACQSAAKQAAVVFRGHKIADSFVYSVQLAGAKPVFLFESEDASRGVRVKVECAGKAERLLVISGEFSSNYLQGLALRFNALKGAWERVDFAERARPQFVFVNEDGWSVVIPNRGNESDKKFLLYSFVSGKGPVEESVGVDALPESGRKFVLR